MRETHRRLYNACLGQRKSVYEKDKISVSYWEQSAWFKNQRAVNPWLAKLNFSSAQATMRRLDKAFAAFFRRLQAGEKPTMQQLRPGCREMFATTPTCLLLRFGAASRRPCGKEHPCPGPDWASRTKCGC